MLQTINLQQEMNQLPRQQTYLPENKENIEKSNIRIEIFFQTMLFANPGCALWYTLEIVKPLHIFGSLN